MRHPIARLPIPARLAVAFAVLLVLTSALRAEVVDIDDAQLASLRQQGIAVVDIRRPEEWRETGVLAGSHLLTFFDAAGRADPPAWLAKLKAIAGPGQPVILICRSGNRSRLASRYLAQQPGYPTVYNAARGIAGWLAAGGRTVMPSQP